MRLVTSNRCGWHLPAAHCGWARCIALVCFQPFSHCSSWAIPFIWGRPHYFRAGMPQQRPCYLTQQPSAVCVAAGRLKQNRPGSIPGTPGTSARAHTLARGGSPAAVVVVVGWGWRWHTLRPVERGTDHGTLGIITICRMACKLTNALRAPRTLPLMWLGLNRHATLAR